MVIVLLKWNILIIMDATESDYSETEVSFGVRFNFDLESEEKNAFVDLKVDIFPDYVEKSSPFKLSIIMRGHFVVDCTEDPTVAKQLLANNAVAIMFPYLRSAVTSITAESGVRPFILPPVNILKLLENAKSTQEKQ